MAKEKTNEIDRSVNAVGRTLSILEAFLKNEDSLSLTDLEDATGLFKSVILRYMLTLEPLNYIYKRPDGKYQLGAKVYELGCRFERSLNISEHVIPVLEELTKITKESSSFYVRDGDSRICLLRVDSPQQLRASIAPGTRLPMDDSATANAFRAFENKSYSKNIVFTSANKINEITASIPLTASMAAPVLKYGSNLVGVITISGPAVRFNPEVEDIKNILKNTVIDLSKRLGGIFE